jgi:hypothetical protein
MSDPLQFPLAIAEQLLSEALNAPEPRAKIQAIVADESINREQLYYQAFAQGVISTLSTFYRSTNN